MSVWWSLRQGEIWQVSTEDLNQSSTKSLQTVRRGCAVSSICRGGRWADCLLRVGRRRHETSLSASHGIPWSQQQLTGRWDCFLFFHASIWIAYLEWSSAWDAVFVLYVPILVLTGSVLLDMYWISRMYPGLLAASQSEPGLVDQPTWAPSL